MLSDDTKRRQYDQFGAAGGGFGGGPQGWGGQAGHPGQAGFHYESTIDPEELFRKIFGDAFKAGGFGFDTDQFATNNAGFGATQEVGVNSLQHHHHCFL